MVEVWWGGRGGVVVEGEGGEEEHRYIPRNSKVGRYLPRYRSVLDRHRGSAAQE